MARNPVRIPAALLALALGSCVAPSWEAVMPDEFAAGYSYGWGTLDGLAPFDDLAFEDEQRAVSATLTWYLGAGPPQRGAWRPLDPIAPMETQDQPEAPGGTGGVFTDADTGTLWISPVLLLQGGGTLSALIGGAIYYYTRRKRGGLQSETDTEDQTA